MDDMDPILPGQPVQTSGSARYPRVVDGTPRLEILKTLGDNTRYAIYLELARSPRPLATAEIADVLDLHANTVRPHLERMRDVGLVAVTTAATGAVGRPQHRYSIAADAPSLGLEPPTMPLLTRILLDGAVAAGLGADEIAEPSREQGRAMRPSTGPLADSSCADALEHRLGELGFDPARVDDGETSSIAFTHCPFRELAEAHPELVCGVHRSLIDGFVDTYPDTEVVAFHPLIDRTPCQVEVRVTAGTGA